MPPNHRRALVLPGAEQAGVGLIEVLIALVVISIGLLGLAALQGRAQQAEMESYQRAQALVLVQDMASRLRANSAQRDLYETKKADCSRDQTTRVGRDLCEWSRALEGWSERIGEKNQTPVGTLIGGYGCIKVQNENEKLTAYEVIVAWQGLGEIDAEQPNDCGKSLIPSKLRRTVSVPVRFFPP